MIPILAFAIRTGELTVVACTNYSPSLEQTQAKMGHGVYDVHDDEVHDVDGVTAGLASLAQIYDQVFNQK